MTIKRTIKLGKDWDLSLDANGQLAVLSSKEAVAQTVANRCRLFVRDASFNYDEGVAYFDTTLGTRVQTAFLSSELRREAEQVEGVTEVVSVTIDQLDLDTRTIKATIVCLCEDSENVFIEI